MSASIRSFSIKKINPDNYTERQDDLSIEEPLEISVILDLNGKKTKKNIAITMRTPGDDEALAIGFLFTEGIVHDPQTIAKTARLHENEISILFQKDFQPELSKLERNFYTSSSCGVCGKASIDAIQTIKPATRINSFGQLNPNILYTLNEKVKQEQAVFQSTGGLHAAALFDTKGNFLQLCEDVGRHNALDKLIGKAFLNNQIPLQQHILFLSGRASFELIQKAAMAGIEVICALGAPSSLAVELAVSFNITLVGFLKNSGFNIYHDDNRILLPTKK